MTTRNEKDPGSPGPHDSPPSTSKKLIRRTSVPIHGLSETERQRVIAALNAATAEGFKKAFRPAFDGSDVGSMSNKELIDLWLDLSDFAMDVYLGFCALANRPGISDPEVISAYESVRAAKMARRKVELDPDGKQAAKAMALELWKERHQGKHPKLRRVADFAAEVMRRAPVLTNAKTIEGWSAKWTKQVRNGENPTC